MFKKGISDKTQGILYIMLAGVFFSLMSLFVRLAGDLPTMQKAFFRNVVALAVSIVILLRTEEKFKIKKGSLPGLLIRSFFGTAGLICNFYAISKIGLADANMLNKMSPFFAIIFSVFVLKEIANKVEWISVLVAFLGVILIIKPSANIASLQGLVGLIGGLCAGLAYTFVRKLGRQGERGPVIVFCFSAFSTLVTLPFLLLQYQPMKWTQLLFLLLAGCMAAGGQLTITKAYTKAPAKEISVFDYMQVIYSALWGILFLHQFPDWMSIVGYVIIIGIAIFKWAYNLKKE